MKTITKRFVVIVTVMVAFISVGNAQSSQWEIKNYMALDGWKYTGEIREASLREGQCNQTWYRSFYEGFDYAVVAFSDDAGVLDIDVKTVYPGNYSHREDSDDSDFAMVTFTPYSNVTLGIEMTNYSSLNSYKSYRCMFMIFYR